MATPGVMLQSLPAPPSSVRFGVAAALASAACFALSMTVIRTAEAPAAQGVFVRGLITAGIAFMVLPRGALRVGRDSWWVALRVVGGAGSILAAYHTLARTSVGTSRALANVAPLLVLGIELLRGREALSGRKAIGAAVALFGVAILLLGGEGTDPTTATIGLVGATFAAVAYVALGEAASRTHPDVVVLGLGLGLTAIGLAGAGPAWRSLEARQLGWLSLAGLAATAAQMLMTRAFARIEASLATLIGLVSLPLGLGLDALVNRRWPTAAELLAYTLVLAGVTLLPATGRRAPGVEIGFERVDASSLDEAAWERLRACLNELRVAAWATRGIDLHIRGVGLCDEIDRNAVHILAWQGRMLAGAARLSHIEPGAPLPTGVHWGDLPADTAGVGLMSRCVVAPTARGGRLSEELDRRRLAELRSGEAAIALSTNAARVEAFERQGFQRLREVPSELTGGTCTVMTRTSSAEPNRFRGRPFQAPR